jgi:hypothetical protein
MMIIPKWIDESPSLREWTHLLAMLAASLRVASRRSPHWKADTPARDARGVPRSASLKLGAPEGIELQEP